MNHDNLDIQELIKESGVPRRTIYFYVQQGILPPPVGAGLSAHYTPAHLLRLKLIPILRAQGLRLDEIRQKLEGMDVEAMERVLKTSPVPAPDPRASLPYLKDGQASLASVSQAAFTHFSLPGGVTLVVPVDLARTEGPTVQKLLDAAVKILRGAGEAQTGTNENGKQTKTGQPGEGRDHQEDPE